MKFPIAISFLALVANNAACVSAFGVPRVHRSQCSSILTVAAAPNNFDGLDDTDHTAGVVSDRRSILKTFGAFAASATATAALTATPLPAFAGLLDEYGSDPSKIQQESKSPPKARVTVSSKAEVDFEPNLRSNYYYPTNKKRYLPRIKKCNDAIPEAANFIGKEDWASAQSFAVDIADDTILPMKLYVSSLLGGGTNVKVAFAKDMKQAAADFEKAQKGLVKGIKTQDQTMSSAALEDLATALLAYRTAGRLLGPDGGGDIPSVDEIRRSACRVQGRTFEKKVKERDERLKSGAVQNS